MRRTPFPSPGSALLLGCLALALGSRESLAQGTLSGAAPLSGAGFTVTVNVPARVGISWNRNVLFDLSSGTQTGSCGSYPPAPATAFPCYWGDENGGGTAMTVQLFANSSGPGNLVQATVLGAGGAFGGSNATIGMVFYGAGNLANCAAGDSTAACVAVGYTQMDSALATVFATTAAPTAGWTTVTNGRKFLFQVNNNLTPTGGSATKTTTFSVTLP